MLVLQYLSNFTTEQHTIVSICINLLVTSHSKGMTGTAILEKRTREGDLLLEQQQQKSSEGIAINVDACAVVVKGSDEHQILQNTSSSGDSTDNDDDDDGSCDTQDAFLDMLGLALDGDDIQKDADSSACNAPLASVLAMDEDLNDKEDSAETIRLPIHERLQAIHIPLPQKCSRYGHAPHQCAAVVVENFWSRQECQDLLKLAQNQARGFDYITEATHTAPDGSQHKVKLQHPNPHKLAVFEDDATLQRLWNRLIYQTELLFEKNITTSTIANKKKCSKWLEPLQQRLQCGPPLGLNPRLRVLQYDASDQDRFEAHFDATTHVRDHVSRITVLLYLNDGDGSEFEGGETLFLNSHISDQCHNHNNNNNNKTSSHNNRQKFLNEGNESTVTITPKKGSLVMFEHDLYHAGAPLLWGTKHVMRTDILFANTEGNTTQDASSCTESTATPASEDSNPVTKGPLLVADVFVQHPTQAGVDGCWTPEFQPVLEDMGLFNMTLEAFLVPGISILTNLLVDGGLNQAHVETFLRVAQDHVQLQQQKQE